MQTRKNRQTGSEPATATSHGQPVALQYAAILPARLALMRWTRGGDLPHLATCESLAGRAAWYDALQGNLQDWLAAGGMHRPEPVDCAEGAPARDVTADTTALAAEPVNSVEPK